MSQLAVVAPPILPALGEWTYEDYLKLPDDGRRYEIIEGVPYVTNAPNADHQFVVTEASRQIGNFVVTHKLGRVLVAPFEVHLTDRSRPVQPDMHFVRAERSPQGQVAFFAGAPDLIVEVVSPSSTRTDRVGGEYALLGEFTGDERLQSLVLAGIHIVTSTLFG